MRTANTAQELDLIDFNINHANFRWEDTAERWVQRSQSGFFVKVFGFFTTPAGRKLLMEKKVIQHLPLQFFLFPIAAVLETAEATMAFKLLYSSRNRNLGKTLDALKKLQKATIITTAIGLSGAAVITGSAALGAVVPLLFVVAMGVHTGYNILEFFKNLYKYVTAPKGSALRETYGKHLVETGIRSVVGVILTAAIAVLFVAAMASPIGLAVASTVTIAAIITGVVVGIVRRMRAKKRAAAAKTRANLRTVAEEQSDVITTALADAATHEQVLAATVAKAEKHQGDYYYTRNLSRLLNAARGGNNDITKLSATFVKIIDEKIARLNEQIKASNDPHRFFARYHRGQNEKRQQKVAALKELKGRISSMRQESNFMLETELNVIIDGYPKVFQSFFKDKGDVEVIFDAAREYFVQTPVVDTEAPADASP